MEDHFDRLPNCILLEILDHVSDAKSLVRCLSVSKRFRSLVPYATSLRLQVDRVIPLSADTSSSFFSFFETLGTFLNLLFPLSFPPPSTYYSPSSILRSFRRVWHLDLQLPSDDGSKRTSGGAFVRYRATFGETLEKCVIIVGFRRKEEAAGDVEQATKATDDEEEEEVKERVLWVIRALVDACKRHDYAARELIGEHLGLARLRISDAAGEGLVEMDERGLDECRKCMVSREGCMVPRVRMQMWYGRKMEVGFDGEVLEGATLVVVRTVKDGSMDTADGDEAAVASEAFGADGYKEAICALMKSRSYSLEMNSFLI